MLRPRPYRLLRVFILLVIASYFGVILCGAVVIGQKLTEPLPGRVCCLALAHEDIHFQTADDLTLAGWYIPPKNGAVIILLHTYYSTRMQTAPIANMLARHGYGVLMIDQRASGESGGDVRSLGWRDIPDVSRAVSFVQSRTGTEKTQIGVYGCSVGGAMALAATAQNLSITAVVADAPSSMSFSENFPTFDDPIWAINMPMYTFYFSFVALRAQALPPMSTRQAAQAIAPRPLLLISTGQPGESQRVDGFYNAAGPGKIQWNIPEAGHCGGPSIRPADYEKHLVDFFDFAFKK